ncbi:MAG: hypothetical protein ACLSF6_01770 [Evtepia gabavorous]
MLRRLYAIAAEGTDPYENLALEAYLLERVQPGSVSCTCGKTSAPW